jgi:predicted nucleic acid-binding protein
MALSREFDLLLSVPLTFEYESFLKRIAHREASRLTLDLTEDLLASLLNIAVEVDLDEYRGPRSSDPGDNHILSLALHGRADAIVTFNMRHFDQPARKLGVKLVTPAQALNILRR